MTFFRVLILALFAVLNLGWAGTVAYLVRHQKDARWIGKAAFLWAALILLLVIVQGFSPPSWRPFLLHYLYLPLSVEMVWNLLFLNALGAIVAILVIGGARRVDRTLDVAPQDLARRRFIYSVACGVAPATAVAMGVHGTVTRNDLRVREMNVPVANLPAELEGFTIAHVSDLHSGIFCGPERLGKIGDAANDLKADLIVLTGDVINSDLAEFRDAAAVISRLESKHGLYLCEGNHDLFSGEAAFAAACAGAGFPLLRDSSAIIEARGARLILGGLPWYSRSFRGNPANVARLFPERREGDVRIVLAHHPNLFDASAPFADLVLSGHTHGGQIMLGPLGFGPLFFEYWSGIYRQGSSTLVVSNGAGDWFPCRIGAPAEIGKLRLVRAG